MKALIFNSGMGQRLGKMTKNMPKCMTLLSNEHSIISWQLKLLEECGVEEIIITTGHCAGELQNYINSLGCHLHITFVHNEDYRETNYIYSMYCAREHLSGDMLMLHGDLVLGQSVLTDMLRENRSVVAVDADSPLPQKDFKAKMLNHKIAKIAVDLFGEDCIACQPMYMLLKNDLQIWLEEVEQFCNNQNRKVYAEEAFNRHSDKINLFGFELNGRLCREIDTIEDLAIIRNIFGNCVKKN